MRLYELYDLLENTAPRELSAPWDNDGIMCAPRGNIELTRVAVSLDATLAAVEKAAENRCELLLTHHPMIFKGIKSLVPDDIASARVMCAVSHGISVISLHTRLDAASGGVNDALAKKLGMKVKRSFGDAETPNLGRLCEIEGDGVPLEALANHVKDALGCEALRVYGKGTVKSIALVGGDGKDFISPAISVGADVLITGDAGYNACESAAENGFCIIEAGHYYTEVPVCEAIAEILRAEGLECIVNDSCPSRII